MMVGEVGSWTSSVFFCVECYTRFKIRASSQGAEVAWIILDRSLYQDKDLVTVYPFLSKTLEDIRCPVCGTDSLKRLQPALRGAPEPLLREAPQTP